MIFTSKQQLQFKKHTSSIFMIFYFNFYKKWRDFEVILHALSFACQDMIIEPLLYISDTHLVQ